MNSLQESLREKISKALPDLKKRYPIERLALFGSVTRPDFNPDKSDIDIMVEFNGDVAWDFFDLKDELEKIVGRNVDLVSNRAIKPHYREYIEKDLINV
ncbi:MAG: nucleotidyltransferase family protein [Chitinophagales bacterium]